MRAFRTVFTVAFALVVFAGFAMANDVHFAVNMNNHDTFDSGAGDYIVVRGDFNGWDDNPEYALADGDADGIWDATIAVDPDSTDDATFPDTSGFKFVAIFNADGEEWEGVDNRPLILPDGTTAVDLDTVWFNDDDPSLVPVTVNFAVNMEYTQTTLDFDPAVDTVIVRGALNGWGGYAEGLVDTNGDFIYVGSFQVAPNTDVFKYVLAQPDGEGGYTDIYENDIENRVIPFGTDPVQLDTVWFNDQEPSATAIDIQVLFQVDMSVQKLLGNFDPDTDGDLIVVRGNNNGIGNWGGAVELVPDALQPGIYSDWITLTAVEPGDSVVEFKYVILNGGDANDASWESRDNRYIETITGDEPDTDDPADGIGNLTLDAVYFDDSDASDYLTSPKDVTFEVDVRDAYLKIADPDSAIVDVQSGDIVTSIDNVNVAGFFNNWPWSNFTDPTHTAADTDGDSIWVTTITLPAGTARDFIYKYGINGYDVEAGFAQNHEVMLTDDGLATTLVDTFGIQGTLYDPYIDQLYFTGVKEIPGALPTEFSLAQNYPNPFNPSTTIAFELPASGLTMLRVYNVMGQQVALQDLGHMNAGRYEISLDASSLSSGVYFYRLESGKFTATKKMMLMK